MRQQIMKYYLKYNSRPGNIFKWQEWKFYMQEAQVQILALHDPPRTSQSGSKRNGEGKTGAWSGRGKGRNNSLYPL